MCRYTFYNNLKNKNKILFQYEYYDKNIKFNFNFCHLLPCYKKYSKQIIVEHIFLLYFY